MTPDDPRHGTNAGAMKHWRDGEKTCDPCRRATTRARLERELAALKGESRMVELGEEAWRIVHDTPRNQLGAATGWSAERILRYDKGGPTKRVHRGTRDKILATKQTWTTVGLSRRVQALSRLGWSAKAQGAHSGLSLNSLYSIRRHKRQFVRLHVAKAILAMYADLSMKMPPPGASATEARNEAIRKGYAPPLAWDDIDHDEAPAAIRGDDYEPTRAEILADLDERHAGVTEACAVLGITRHALQKWCGNHGMHALYQRLGSRELRRAENQWTKRGAA